MYALIIKSECLPTVVSIQSHFYCDFIQAGYEVIQIGQKRDMEAIYEEMIEEYCNQD